MSYNVRVYHNSGFNSQNTPDSPALLESVPYTDLPAIDTLQEGFLDSVSVRTTWGTISDVDFCRVGNFYYSVAGAPRMTSGDVAVLVLIPDYILSIGGISNLTFLDGITERVHVPKNFDDFGAYGEDDPFIRPMEPLKLKAVRYVHTPEAYIFVESPVNLTDLQNTTNSLTFTDAVNPQQGEVSIPFIKPLVLTTRHSFGGDHATLTYVLGEMDGQGGISYNQNVMEGLSRARALGIESVITAMYAVPKALCAKTMGTTVGEVVYLDGVSGCDDWGGYYEYASVENKRLLYGRTSAYGILSMSGSKVEFDPEDIYHAGDTQPKIAFVSDPRADGTTYFRFQYYLGEAGHNGSGQTVADVDASFWRNCISGAPWQNVPIVYDRGGSGWMINRLQHDTRVSMMESTNELARWGETARWIGDGLNSAGSVFGDTMESMEGMGEYNPATFGSYQQATGANLAAMTARVAGAGVRHVAADVARRNTYNMARVREGLNYQLNQNIVAPDLQFPYNSNIMRDAMGNGCIVYRYELSSNDLARCDKLLTMYGYRLTKPIEGSDFTNRSKFNYVKAHGVSVGNLPQWYADGVAAQLADGVRFWHVLPDESIYTDGSNI